MEDEEKANDPSNYAPDCRSRVADHLLSRFRGSYRAGLPLLDAHHRPPARSNWLGPSWPTRCSG